MSIFSKSVAFGFVQRFFCWVEFGPFVSLWLALRMSLEDFALQSGVLVCGGKATTKGSKNHGKQLFSLQKTWFLGCKNKVVDGFGGGCKRTLGLHPF